MPHLINAASIAGRRTAIAWWCGTCNSRNEGNSRECSSCSAPHHERHAQVHASERAVYYRHPLTGEIRRPARADQPMPEIYAKQGFVREEVMSMIRHEKETGSIHEASTFARGSEPVPEQTAPLTAPREIKEQIINDIRAAHQSGDWTCAVELQDAPPGERL